jgi:integrase
MGRNPCCSSFPECTSSWLVGLSLRPVIKSHCARPTDTPAAQWRIPADCMKARVQHLVPLSRQALELLLKLRTISGDGEYVFPLLRDPSRPLHGTALSGALRSLGFERSEVAPHGFRATACTLLNELGWRPEAIERQVAHGVSDSVRRHYKYAQHLPERRVMMQASAAWMGCVRPVQLVRWDRANRE